MGLLDQVSDKEGSVDLLRQNQTSSPLLHYFWLMSAQPQLQSQVWLAGSALAEQLQ